MQLQRTPDLFEGIAKMPNDELAVALFASDMPTDAPVGEYGTIEQITAWVRQGVERMGGERAVWWHAYQQRQFVGATGSRRLTPQERTEEKRLNLRGKRTDRTLAVAYRLMREMDKAGVERSFPFTKVETYDPVSGGTIITQISERDLEMARRGSAAGAGVAA